MKLTKGWEFINKKKKEMSKFGSIFIVKMKTHHQVERSLNDNEWLSSTQNLVMKIHYYVKNSLLRWKFIIKMKNHDLDENSKFRWKFSI